MTGLAVATLFVLSTGSVSTRTRSDPPHSVPLGLAVSSALTVQPLAGSAPEAAAEVAPAAAEAARPAPAPGPDEVVIAPPPAVFDAPPAPPRPPPPALSLPPPVGSVQSGGTWAVIVGINDYPGSRSDLRSAVNDANDMDMALAGMGVPPENRLLLRDGQATADGIRRSVDWLVSRAGPDATAVFFYGGHVRKIGVTSEAMVAADGGLIEDRELGERLSHLNARRSWIAIAACFGAGFTEVLAPGRVLTGAAPADALAYESSEFGRSYMVQYMVREAMLEKRAASSVQAAFAYAITELAKEHPGRQPVQLDAGFGPLDLRPFLTPPAPPDPAAVQVTVPPAPPTTVCRQLLLFACS